MKKMRLRLVLSVFAFILLMSISSLAQSQTPTTTGKSDPDQVMKDLLNEVRQLRIALQRTTVNAYRAQVTLERLRIQQQQVTEISQELNKVRGQLSEVRSEQIEAKSRIEELEKRKDAGVGGDSEIKAMQGAVEEANRREQQLISRESELSIQLTTEQGKLDDLNKRLDDMEHEVMTNAEDEIKQIKNPPNY